MILPIGKTIQNYGPNKLVTNSFMRNLQHCTVYKWIENGRTTWRKATIEEYNYKKTMSEALDKNGKPVKGSKSSSEWIG